MPSPWFEHRLAHLNCTIAPPHSSLFAITQSAHEAPSSHAAIQTVLITAHFPPASPLTPQFLAGSRHPYALRDHHYFSSLAKPAILHLSDWFSALTLDQIQSTHSVHARSTNSDCSAHTLFSHHAKKSVSHCQSPTIQDTTSTVETGCFMICSIH